MVSRDAEAEAPILWPPDAKSWLTGKVLDAGKDWRWEEKGVTEDEMVGWHHRLNGHEFEQAPGDGDGQGGLVCCRPWGHKGSDMTEQLINNNSRERWKWLTGQSPVGRSSYPLLWSRGPQPLVPVYDMLVTGPHSRRRAVGERVKLVHCSHYCLSSTSCQISGDIINVMHLNHPETTSPPSVEKLSSTKLGPGVKNLENCCFKETCSFFLCRTSRLLLSRASCTPRKPPCPSPGDSARQHGSRLRVLLGLSSKEQSLTVCPEQATNPVRKTERAPNSATCPESLSQRVFQARQGYLEDKFGSSSNFSFQIVTTSIFSKVSIE